MSNSAPNGLLLCTRSLTIAWARSTEKRPQRRMMTKRLSRLLRRTKLLSIVQETNMANDTHLAAPTLFIQANAVRYAFRRFGSQSGTPLVFLQHFRGGLDNWDPHVTDGLAQGRPVILFNNAGVASSSGETPQTIDEMSDHVAAFLEALGLRLVDVLGFSIGGYVAQSLVLRHPRLVRRLVLVGTGPRNGEPSNNPRIFEVATNPVPTL